MSWLDADGDGEISSSELAALDIDGDGKISKVLHNFAFTTSTSIKVAYFEGRAARCPGLCPGPWLPQRAGHPGRPGHEGGGGRGRGQRAHCRGDQHSHSLVRGIIVKYYP